MHSTDAVCFARYWMYAAVKAGPKGLLISNDEMRDHLFQLLAPRFFQKWKQRHQASISFTHVCVFFPLFVSLISCVYSHILAVIQHRLVRVIDMCVLILLFRCVTQS